jgi:hypothetical protein
MWVEIDQSGKVERTQVPSALAFASQDKQFTLFVSANAKREVLADLRQRRVGRKTKQHILVFATLVYLLVKDYLDQIERWSLSW